MNTFADWWIAFQESFMSSLAEFGAQLPGLAAAAAIMLLGWLFASLLRAILLRCEGALNHAVERFGQPMTAARLRISHRLVTLAAKFAFWVAVLLFAAMAARVAGLDAFSVWLDRVVAYLPTLLAGLLIAFAGYLLSTLVRDVVSTTLISVGLRDSELAGIAAQGAVFVTALVIGLDQIGIDVTFLIILSAVLIGGALLGIALAFGFGAREFVGNLIAAQQLRGTLETGDRANVDGVEGRILQITATSIVLVSEKGRYLVPASNFQRSIAAILSSDADE